MALIVEFFGPPGSGKTTFAKALAARLRDGGVDVGLHLSSRPGEAGSGGPAAANFGRIARPIREFMSTAISRRTRREVFARARLSRFIAAFGPLRKLRLRQYERRLATEWARAEARSGVFIFDQGYLQLVATLLALGRKAESHDASEAIKEVPSADIALCLDAAPEELASRLRERFKRVGAIGRLLEAGGGPGDSYLAVGRLLRDALTEEGRMTLTARSSDDEGFAQEVERVAQVVRRSLIHRNVWRP